MILMNIFIPDIEAVEDVMTLAHRHRTTGSTDMNSVSSRSQ